MEETIKIIKGNFFIRLLKGEIPLIVTYWVFGVLIGGVFSRICLAVIENYYTSLIIWAGSAIFVKVIIWLIIGYSVFMLIAIWRSARKYTGDKLWANLAKFAVIFNIILLVGSFWLASDTNYVLKQDIRMLNKGLPAMIDNETRLDEITLEGHNLYYIFTLVNLLSTNVNVEHFNTNMVLKVITSSCETSNTKLLLEEGRSLTYIYRDKEKNFISRFMVTLDECL